MTYRVVLGGGIAPGADLGEVRRKFMAATGQPEAVAIRLFLGKPNVIKRDLSQSEADRIVSMLVQIGAIASAEAEGPAFTIDESEVRAFTPFAPPPAPPVASSAIAPKNSAATSANSPNGGSPTPQAALPAYLAERGINTRDGTEQLTSEAMYRAIIGSKNTDYYLRYFARRDAGGSFLSWNWPCALTQFWWALYRKCYGFAFGGLLLAIVFGAIAGAIYGGIAGAMGANVKTIESFASLVGWLGGWFVGAFANGFYYRKAHKLIRDTAHISDSSARIVELARRGGTTGLWLWIFLVIFIVGLLGAIALPAYQDYVKRAQRSASTRTSPLTNPNFDKAPTNTWRPA